MVHAKFSTKAMKKTDGFFLFVDMTAEDLLKKMYELRADGQTCEKIIIPECRIFDVPVVFGDVESLEVLGFRATCRFCGTEPVTGNEAVDETHRVSCSQRRPSRRETQNATGQRRSE